MQDFFGKYGKMKHIQLVVDRYTNKSRGFAFIHYEDIDDAIEVCVPSVMFEGSKAHNQ